MVAKGGELACHMGGVTKTVEKMTEIERKR